LLFRAFLAFFAFAFFAFFAIVVLFGCWRHALEGAALPHATSGLLIRLRLSAIEPLKHVGNPARRCSEFETRPANRVVP
jgi:hypothetical protein